MVCAKGIDADATINRLNTMMVDTEVNSTELMGGIHWRLFLAETLLAERDEESEEVVEWGAGITQPKY